MLTDPITDLRALLRSQPALIVHFSGVPKGTGHVTHYPKDLRFALANPQEILCCSTIEPRDFDAPPFGAMGFVGVVLDPIGEDSICRVLHDDDGAPPSTAARKALERPQSLADCKRTFIRNGALRYNEWLVGPSRVVGLFIAPRADIQLENGDYAAVDAENLIAEFGNCRIFSCDEQGFTEYSHGTWQPADMGTVYP